MATEESMCDQEKAIAKVKGLIRNFPNFPKPGIQFKDICPILKDPSALKTITDVIKDHIRKNLGKIDAIVGLEARGFLFGTPIAMGLNLPFIPIRKLGKLPGPTVQATYSKEYGKDVFEIQQDALSAGQKVVIIDDLIATGGTLVAACNLIKSCNAEVVQCVTLVELEELNGKAIVPCPTHVILKL